MSRLRAVEQLLYYPTPEPVVTALTPLLHVPARPSGFVRLLDPCIGTGRAVQLLAESLTRQSGSFHPRLEVYGIEPHQQRARLAAKALGEEQVLHTSYFTATLSQGGFQLIFLNPPYDQETETQKARERLELTFLRRATLHLAPGGVLIWIVPQARLSQAAQYLAAHYQQVGCWRFPDEEWAPPDMPNRKSAPMYELFKQIVLIGVRRAAPVPAESAQVQQIQSWGEAGEALAILPGEETDTPPYLVPLAEPRRLLFASTVFDADAAARQLSAGLGLWGTPTYLEQHWPDPAQVVGLGMGRPLAPLRVGHLGVLVAAGIANGAAVEGVDGQQVVVKGACRKKVLAEETVVERDDGVQEVTTTLTDTYEMSVWCRDLETGDLYKVQ
jgi:hypothetical protein